MIMYDKFIFKETLTYRLVAKTMENENKHWQITSAAAELVVVTLANLAHMHARTSMSPGESGDSL
jgi:hypothetical protein